ncbi:S1 RNA-binding domain-containing protein [Streptococcus sp. DD13]|uniref:S1 RNA-binding domain-containing protein n=1 Tax=Streptococcus sp. DD13 TaxID=1777881 RepID=UPI00079C604A|nr:S1 RNA-binding domain-containing protein [Streptococcus sp. DD13]KXT77458.1 General stress protein 13 [Streptococcus sp. DD13]
MKIGEKFKGKVIGIQPYGAFVELESGFVGLVHISEVKTGYVDDIHHFLKIGQDVEVQVVDYDEFSQKASLSLRTLEEEKHRIPRRRRFSSDRHKTGFKPLADQLPIWIQEGKEFLAHSHDA